jgi:Ni/Co efflux regulator RcnB
LPGNERILNGPFTLPQNPFSHPARHVETTWISQELYMKRVAVVGALVASLLAGSAVMAHDRGDFDHREPPRAHHDRFVDRDVHRAPPRVLYHTPVRYGVYHRPRGYYEHTWRRGERLPVAFYSRPYVIANYRDCGLRAPPRGYQWVRVNGDAVLAGIATGVVLESVFHIFG